MADTTITTNHNQSLGNIDNIPTEFLMMTELQSITEIDKDNFENFLSTIEADKSKDDASMPINNVFEKPIERIGIHIFSGDIEEANTLVAQALRELNTELQTELKSIFDDE